MKRVLLLDHPQFTSATYFLWYGLKELESLYPNKISVACYPYIPTHFEGKSFVLSTMPWFQDLSKKVEEWKKNPDSRPQGIPPFQENEYLTAQNEDEIRRSYPWRDFAKTDLIHDETSVVNLLLEGYFDLVILGNSHRVPTILLSLLKEKVKKLPPLVYLDAGERDELNEHWIHVFKPDLVFKQILTPEVKEKGLSVPIPGYPLKIYPLPLSSPLVELEEDCLGIPLQWLRKFSQCNCKIFSVFYAMGMTWPDRGPVVEALNKFVRQNEMSIAYGAMGGSYHLCLALSKMGVTMRGSGRDTTRYWEIPLYRTAMVCDGTMGCIHPYPFEDMKTAFFYKSVDQMMQIVKDHQRIEDPDLWKISEDGQKHLERYHSTAARAVFFLDIVHQELTFQDSGLRNVLARWKKDHKWDDRPWQGPVV